jgi:hypothetical protein
MGKVTRLQKIYSGNCLESQMMGKELAITVGFSTNGLTTLAISARFFRFRLAVGKHFGFKKINK